MLTSTREVIKLETKHQMTDSKELATTSSNNYSTYYVTLFKLMPVRGLTFSHLKQQIVRLVILHILFSAKVLTLRESEK